MTTHLAIGSGLLVLSLTGRTSCVKQGDGWSGIVENRLPVGQVGIMLMDVVDGDAAHVPILWGEVKGWNSIEELLFLDVNGKKFRLLGHLKNGPSDVLWNTVNQF